MGNWRLRLASHRLMGRLALNPRPRALSFCFFLSSFVFLSPLYQGVGRLGKDEATCQQDGSRHGGEPEGQAPTPIPVLDAIAATGARDGRGHGRRRAGSGQLVSSVMAVASR